jgi:hypothetical protein
VELDGGEELLQQTKSSTGSYLLAFQFIQSTNDQFYPFFKFKSTSLTHQSECLPPEPRYVELETALKLDIF